jgi:methylated-DNA-[protein]-cysteine S-methyltransferase
MENKQDFKYYIESPLGDIEIISDGLMVNEISFIEEKGENSSEVLAVVTTCIQELNAYFKGENNLFTFDFQQKGTDFQQIVWEELTKIPSGKTMSYLELSRKIGNEKAIRAVGTTNGKNKIAVVVPCHRVIGSDGSMTGYAGGIWRKEWLLNHERKMKGGSGEQLNIFG